jgi:hypothetical protein
MDDLRSTFAAHRQEIDIYIDVAKALDPARWAAPPAAGRWSPAQITDHLFRTYEFGSGVIEGTVTVQRLPALMRWMIARFWLRPALRNGRVTGRTRAPKFFEPDAAGGAPEDLLPRLRTASERFAGLVDRGTGRGVAAVDHPMFGSVPLIDFLRLQVIHVRHHRAQLPPASA